MQMCQLCFLLDTPWCWRKFSLIRFPDQFKNRKTTTNFSWNVVLIGQKTRNLHLFLLIYALRLTIMARSFLLWFFCTSGKHWAEIWTTSRSTRERHGEHSSRRHSKVQNPNRQRRKVFPPQQHSVKITAFNRQLNTQKVQTYTSVVSGEDTV